MLMTLEAGGRQMVAGGQKTVPAKVDGGGGGDQWEVLGCFILGN